MKAILALAALIALAVFCGWLSFSQTDGRISAELDSKEMKQDVEQAVETVREKTRDGIEEIQQHDNK